MNIPLNTIVQWTLLTFPVFWMGVGRQFPFSLLGETHGAWVKSLFWAVLTALWCMGVVLSFRSPEFLKKVIRWNERHWKKLLILGIILIPVFDSVSASVFQRFGYKMPIGLWAIDFLFLGWVLHREKNEEAINFESQLFRGAWIFAVVHQCVSLFYFPIHAGRSDMLPLIQVAAENFLHGKMAYTAQLTSDSIFIPYPPLMWMSYLPCALLGVDFRWMNGVMGLVLGGLAEWKKSTLTQNARIFGILMSFWFLNPFLLFRHDLYLHFFWLVMAAVSFAAMRRKLLWTSLGAIVASLTMIWAWICVPFLVLLAGRHHGFDRFQKGLQILLAALCIVGLSGLGFFIFYLKEGAIFLNAVTTHFRLIAEHFTYTDSCLGFGAWLIVQQWPINLHFIQKILLVSMGTWACLFWYNNKKDGYLTASLLLTFFMFLWISPLVESYHYFLPILMMAFLM